MIKLVSSIQIVGETVSLGKDDIENYDELVELITDDTVHPVSFKYDGEVYHADITRYETEDGDVEFALVFDRSVILPSGVCMYVDVDTEASDEQTCYNTRVKLKDITSATRLMVLDSKGCPIGYMTIADIVKQVAIPTLCDIIGDTGIEDGNVVAESKVLTTTGGCAITAVPLSDISCS